MKNLLFPALVITAVFTGLEISVRRAARTGLEQRIMVDGLLVGLVIGFVVSHLVFMVTFLPGRIMENPLSLLTSWGGINSFGGFFGGFFSAAAYLRIKRVPVMSYIDASLFGFAPAWIIGRLGCTIVFDHPGLPTDFFLGMTDAAGVVRHNLGFYEMLWTIVITAALYGLRNVQPFAGFHTVLVIFLYAPARFFLDTLRVNDARYWGWTPGQHFSVILLVTGIMLLLRALRQDREQGKVN